jgi:hypothetical protein
VAVENDLLLQGAPSEEAAADSASTESTADAQPPSADVNQEAVPEATEGEPSTESLPSGELVGPPSESDTGLEGAEAGQEPFTQADTEARSYEDLAYEGVPEGERGDVASDEEGYTGTGEFRGEEPAPIEGSTEGGVPEAGGEGSIGDILPDTETTGEVSGAETSAEVVAEQPAVETAPLDMTNPEVAALVADAAIDFNCEQQAQYSETQFALDEAAQVLAVETGSEEGYADDTASAEGIESVAGATVDAEAAMGKKAQVLAAGISEMANLVQGAAVGGSSDSATGALAGDPIAAAMHAFVGSENFQQIFSESGVDPSAFSAVQEKFSGMMEAMAHRFQEMAPEMGSMEQGLGANPAMGTMPMPAGPEGMAMPMPMFDPGMAVAMFSAAFNEKIDTAQFSEAMGNFMEAKMQAFEAFHEQFGAEGFDPSNFAPGEHGPGDFGPFAGPMPVGGDFGQFMPAGMEGNFGAMMGPMTSGEGMMGAMMGAMMGGEGMMDMASASAAFASGAGMGMDPAAALAAMESMGLDPAAAAALDVFMAPIIEGLAQQIAQDIQANVIQHLPPAEQQAAQTALAAINGDFVPGVTALGIERTLNVDLGDTYNGQEGLGLEHLHYTPTQDLDGDQIVPFPHYDASITVHKNHEQYPGDVVLETQAHVPNIQ